MAEPPPLTIGTAGWAIPRAVAAAFPLQGSALERYASRFAGVEINSTFYRLHRPSTFLRWSTATPPQFRFAAKIPRAITHEARLRDCHGLLATFVQEVEPLGEKLSFLLIQLPPSLAFEPSVAADFFGGLRALAPDKLLACEPRHTSWFEAEADALLARLHVARVAADPLRHPTADRPGGWREVEYHRLHGSPRIYRSPYEPAYLEALAGRLAASEAAQVWCMFDNTSAGAAAANALELDGLAKHRPTPLGPL